MQTSHGKTPDGRFGRCPSGLQESRERKPFLSHHLLNWENKFSQLRLNSAVANITFEFGIRKLILICTHNCWWLVEEQEYTQPQRIRFWMWTREYSSFPYTPWPLFQLYLNYSPIEEVFPHFALSLNLHTGCTPTNGTHGLLHPLSKL